MIISIIFIDNKIIDAILILHIIFYYSIICDILICYTSVYVGSRAFLLNFTSEKGHKRPRSWKFYLLYHPGFSQRTLGLQCSMFWTGLRIEGLSVTHLIICVRITHSEDTVLRRVTVCIHQTTISWPL